MPAPPPAFYPENVLENAIFTMTPDGAVSGKGVERLDDRDVGLECEDAGTAGQRIWHVDRGLSAPTPTVHAWLFQGRNLIGNTFTLETSTDNSAWTSRGTIAPASDLAQRLVFGTPFAVPRYVRWHTTGPSLPVIFTESHISPQIAFKWKPTAGSMREPHQINVRVLASASGRTWGVKRGPRRWSSTFIVSSSPDVDRQQMLAMLDDLDDTAKPFWYLSPVNEVRWVRLSAVIEFTGVDKSPTGEWDIPVAVVEELP